MSRRVELFALLFLDTAALWAAFGAFHGVGLRNDWLTSSLIETPLTAGGALWIGWVVLFGFAGLYQDRYARGRFDELVTLLKVVTFGALSLFFVYALDRFTPDAARAAMLVYSGAVLVAVGTGRVALHAVRKALILRGHGRHRAVVVGWGDRVQTLYEDLARYPAAGIKVAGAVRLTPEAIRVHHAVPVGASSRDLPDGDALPHGAIEIEVGGGPERAISRLPGLVERLGVTEVLIALGPGDHRYLDQVLRVLDGKPLTLKLVPDFYTAVGGMARTEHTYGLPLIEVLPEPIPAWEKRTKRLLDVVVSALVLAVGAPLWGAVAASVRLTSPGPAIYRQTRVGRHGKEFTIFKFRTMLHEAERHSGPVWAGKNDRRVTRLGRHLRRLRLDEVPQFWNVLRGEMSLVGPRPERPYFVKQLAEEIPLYTRRHRVQPGITGLAQVKWRYDTSIEDVRQKLKFDLFYIENMSLRMDATILLQTIRAALLREGQ